MAKSPIFLTAIILTLTLATLAAGFDITPAADPDDINVLETETPSAIPPPSDDITSEPPGDIIDSPLAPVPPAPPPVRPPQSREELGRMSRDELFRLAFGAGAERPRNLMLTLIVEGRRLGVAEVVFDADFAAFNFISPSLPRFLDTLLLPEVRPKAGDSAGYFRSTVLQAAGYTVAANELMHELRILLPAEGKRISRTNLRGGHFWEPLGEPVRPAFLSFYLNYRLTENFSYWRTDRDPFGGDADYRENFTRAPAALNLDGAVTMFKWVLEGSARINEPPHGEPFTWDNYQRGAVRLVRDFIPRHSRVAVGDIGMIFGGGTVGGVRYEYSRSLFGSNPRDDESKIAFFMPGAGHVEVFMDDIYKQRFYLPAGHHEVSGFGGEEGRNSVRLVLRMDDGSVEEVPFEYIMGGPRNIGRGESRYTVTAGVRREPVPSPACFEYIIDDPALSFDYLYGLTRSVSAGLSGITTRYNNAAQTQIVWDIGRLGWVNLQGGANYMPGAEEPFGHRADFSYSPNLSPGISWVNRRLGGGITGGGPLPNLGMSVRGYYQSLAYTPAPFIDQTQQNSNIAGISGSLGFGFLFGNISGIGGVNFNRETAANTENFHSVDYSYGARLSQTIYRIPINASVGVDVVGGVRRPYFSINMSHGFGVGAGLSKNIGRHRLSASTGIGTSMAYAPLVLQEFMDPVTGEVWYEMVPDESVGIGMGGNASFGWRWSNGNYGAGARSYSASTKVPNIFDPSIPGFGGSLQSTYNRAELTANYNYTSAGAFTVNMQHHSLNAALSGSFMFADGLWAFGRPVTGGGFALTDARHSLKGSNVHVDRSHRHMQDYSRSGWLGAAYQNRISPYHPTYLMLTLTETPLGAMMQNNRFYTTGGYKQGYALRLGSRAGVLMEARLISGGQPVSYAYVTIEPEGPRGEQDRRATFTRGNGALQIGELTPGHTYRLKFTRASGLKDALITIPRGSDLILELGDIEVERDL